MDARSCRDRFVVVDTETTGLSHADRIVEVAALEVDPRTGTTGRCLHTLVDPGVPIPANVTRIHGIGSADVSGKPTFARLARDLAAFLGGATVVAQNAPFDARMLDAEFARAGRPSLDALGIRLVDTARASRSLFPFERGHALDAVCDRLGVDRSQRRTHGALIDAQLLGRTLPCLARAYDACCAASDPPLHAGLDAFLRTLHDGVQSVLGAADCAAMAADRERACVRINATLTLLRMLEREALAALASVAPPADWCSNRYVVRRTASTHVAWKDAAFVYLSERDLLPFRSSESQRRLNIPRTTVESGDEVLFTNLRALAGAPLAGHDLATLAAFSVAVSDACAGLDAQRTVLRELLIADVARGHDCTTVHFTTTHGERTDYRGAIAALAPEADLAPFTIRDERLSVRSRDFSACELLFGAPRQTPRVAA